MRQALPARTASPSTSASCSTATGAGPRASARDTAHGHRAGAANIEPLLGWCEEVGVEVVTLWLLSTDNLNRPAERARAAARRSSRTPSSALAEQRRWRLHPVGALDLLPAADRRAGSRRPRRPPATSTGCWSTSPSAYGGRREIADAVRSLLHEHAERGTTPRGAGRGHRRRAHRRAPLHQGPARPRPGDPHLAASSGSAASCSGRARRASSTSARPTGPTSAGSTSCAPIRAYAERERRYGA